MAKQNPRRELRRLQENLYQQSWKEAMALPALNSRSVRHYREAYLNSLPEHFEQIDRQGFLDRMAGFRWLIFGDFHTLAQSQKAFIDTVKSFSRRHPDQPVAIALEAFKSKDQPLIDALISGDLPEKEFLARTDYEKEWGFPWKNYRRIFDLATAAGIPVRGINSDQSGRDTLQHRDAWAAATLHKMAEDFSQRKIFCLIGEHHLADNSLVHHMQQTAVAGAPSWARIFTNVDRYYFSIPPDRTPAPSEFLALSDNSFCILNTPPWIKWQSFCLWEEMRYVDSAAGEGGMTSDTVDEQDEDEDDIYTEEVFDTDSRVFSMLETLTRFLGITVKKNDLTRSRIVTYPGLNDFHDIRSCYQLSLRDLQSAIARTGQDGFHFFPPGHEIFVAEITLNNLAHASGQFLRSILQPPRSSRLSLRARFLQRILYYSAGMLASKILNPRKKGRDIWHYQHLARTPVDDATAQTALSGARAHLRLRLQRKQQAAAAVVRFHNHLCGIDPEAADPLDEICRLDNQCNWSVSRAIGHVLGFTLYNRYMGHSADSVALRSLFAPPRDGESPEQQFRRLYLQIR